MQHFLEENILVTQALLDSPERLQRLVEINQKISATLELPELLQAIVNAAAELTTSEQASLAEYSEEDNSLRFVAAHWMEEDVMASTRIPLDGSISGRAFQDKRPVVVQNAQEEDFYRQVDKNTGFKTHSVLSVPLMMRGEATGTLSALNKNRGGEYDVQDIIVMETLASQAAIALENARLLNESREAYSKLAEIDEMKNNFIAISSHELRIPLGLILGHATYLKDLLEGEERDQVDVIERSALRLKDIVEDLSQIENLQSDTAALRSNICDLNAVLMKIISGQQSSAEDKSIKFISKMPTGSVNIFGEEDKLRIAFNHLAKNAISFTNEGGTVEISLIKGEKQAEIFISDTGIGIPKGDLDNIFNRFFQVEEHMTRRRGGMGLGLTVAKAMIELHKGKIVVDSVEGKGSRFHITLPLAVKE